MTRFSNLTSRNLLIALHDALATVLAVLASFALRFSGDFLGDRWPLLLIILPPFVLFSIVICFVFGLTTTQRRPLPPPDAPTIAPAAPTPPAAPPAPAYTSPPPNPPPPPPSGNPTT